MGKNSSPAKSISTPPYVIAVMASVSGRWHRCLAPWAVGDGQSNMEIGLKKARWQHVGDSTTHVVKWEPNKSQKLQHVKDTTRSFCFIVKRISGESIWDTCLEFVHGTVDTVCIGSAESKEDGQQRLHQFLIASLRNMLCVCLCRSVFWGVQCEQSFTDLA